MKFISLVAGIKAQTKIHAFFENELMEILKSEMETNLNNLIISLLMESDIKSELRIDT